MVIPGKWEWEVGKGRNVKHFLLRLLNYTEGFSMIVYYFYSLKHLFLSKEDDILQKKILPQIIKIGSL